MFKKILVGVDGSENGKKALREAALIAKEFSGELVILHVEELSPYGALRGMKTPWWNGIPAEVIREVSESGKKIVDAAANQAMKETPEVKTLVEIGPPARVICDAAKRENCDLVVLGSRGLNELKGFFLGSVSHEVLQKSRCPVLLIKD